MMVVDNCCCFFDLRVGVVAIGVLQILKGTSFLFVGIHWDTAITAIAYIVAGGCIVNGGIRRHTSSILVSLVFLVVGAIFLVLSLSRTFAINKVVDLQTNEFRTVLLGVGTLLLSTLIDVYFGICCYSFWKRLKAEEKEGSCSKILF